MSIQDFIKIFRFSLLLPWLTQTHGISYETGMGFISGSKFRSECAVKTSVSQKATDATYAQTVYGFGISYNIKPKWGVSSEYVWTKKGQSDTTQNASMGIGIRFKF